MALDFLMTVGAAPPPAGTITSTIQQRATTSAAPETIKLSFDMSNTGFVETGDDLLTMVEYRTTFSRPYNHQFLTNLALLPGNQEQAHIVRGPEPSYTAREPGPLSWTVEAWGRDANGDRLLATGTGSTTIGDPDVVFAGTSTIWVSPNGLTAGQPAGSVAVTSIQAALDLTYNVTEPRRIMLNSADTFPGLGSGVAASPSTAFVAWGAYNIGNGQNGGTLHIVASGAPVDLQAGLTFNYANYDVEKDFVLQNVNLDRGYRPVTQDGLTDAQSRNYAPPGFESTVGLAYVFGPKYALFDGCIIRGGQACMDIVDQGNFGSPEAPLRMVTINDCQFTDWFHIGLTAYRGVEHLNISGWRAFPNPLADVRRFRRDGSTDDGGAPTRGDVPNLNATKLDITSRQGWAPFSPPMFSQQPLMRIRADGVPGGRAYVTQLVGEGSYRPIRFEATQPATPSTGVMLLDSAFLVGVHQTDVFIETNQAKLVVRNVIGLQPAYPSPPRRTGSFINFVTPSSGITADPAMYNEPMRVYNCGLLVLANESTPFTRFLTVNGGTGNFSLDDNGGTVATDNNYVYTTSLTTAGPFDLSSNIFPTSELGYFSGIDDAGTRATPFAGTVPPALTSTFPVPQAGAGVLGGATSGLVAALDFAGVERPIGNQDVGPIQVSL